MSQTGFVLAMVFVEAAVRRLLKEQPLRDAVQTPEIILGVMRTRIGGGDAASSVSLRFAGEIEQIGR